METRRTQGRDGDPGGRPTPGPDRTRRTDPGAGQRGWVQADGAGPGPPVQRASPSRRGRRTPLRSQQGSTDLRRSEIAMTQAPSSTPAANRLVALDALRGFDMFWI